MRGTCNCQCESAYIYGIMTRKGHDSCNKIFFYLWYVTRTTRNTVPTASCTLSVTTSTLRQRYIVFFTFMGSSIEMTLLSPPGQNHSSRLNLTVILCFKNAHWTEIYVRHINYLLILIFAQRVWYWKVLEHRISCQRHIKCHSDSRN